MDLNQLGFRVKRRLDEIFPDDTEPSDALREKREGLSFALSGLQSIAGRLQWRIPEGALEAYAAELKRLRSAFADERHMLVLIKLQSELCRYMLERRRNIPPQALMVLMMAYKVMERLATDHGLSVPSQRRLVERVLTEFMEFKHALSADGGSPLRGRRPHPETGPHATAPLSSRAYYLVPVDHLEELRAFLREEFRHLGRMLIAARA